MAQAGLAQATCRPCPPALVVDSFSSSLLDQAFVCQVVFLEGSLMVVVCLGQAAPRFDNLNVGMLTRFTPDAVVTSVIGDSEEGYGMAKRLSKRLGQPVFVSCNLEGAESPEQLSAFIEKKLCDWIAGKTAAAAAASAAPIEPE